MYRKVIRVRDCVIGISAFERLVYTGSFGFRGG